jgi:parallel beta-helix repeat protein
MKKLIPASILLLVLFSVLVSFQGIKPAGATVYINIFGVINPSSAPIQQSGNVYTFTADINDAIQIQADNIIVDGASHIVQGAGTDTGVIIGNIPDLPIVYNVTLKNLMINTFGGGVLLRNCLNCSIVNVNITVIGNDAISIYDSSNNTIMENNVRAQTAGIRLDQAYNNTVLRNNVTNSYDGIEIWGSSNNTVVENNITNNSWGIRLTDSSSNNFYHNNLVNNTHQVYLDNEGKDIWDNGFPSGGNYWSDYETRYPNATEQNHSGIWNTPYLIDSNNKDNYPLIPESLSPTILPFMMAVLLAAAFHRRNARDATEKSESRALENSTSAR